MADRLKRIREKQQQRRELLAKQLGVDGADKLHTVLSSKDEQREKLIDRKETTLVSPDSDHEPPPKVRLVSEKSNEDDGETASAPDTSKGQKKSETEEDRKVYKDSSTFLKGTQSLNPHNDYCQNYVDTGQRPQNYIRDVGLADRFDEYPKLKDLTYMKNELIRKTNTPPMYLRCDLENFDLSDLGSKFEVLLIQPPLEEYRRQAGLPSNGTKSWSWEDIMGLEIEEIAAPRSFVFLWCGSLDGLDDGRQCLKKWGFRRCEDICWIKTNFKKRVPTTLDQGALFVCTKEHCLMGIKGTVRRSTDGDFIHANVDIDLIIDEERELGNEEKPEEIFHLIEHFCLSRRRLHLFGEDSSIRPGWVTVGPGLTNSNFDAETYRNYFKITEEHPHGCLTGCTEEIERLRPKTPPPRDKKSERGNHHGAPSRGSRGGGGSRRGGSSHGENSGVGVLPQGGRNSGGWEGSPGTGMPLIPGSSFRDGLSRGRGHLHRGGRSNYLGKKDTPWRGGFKRK